MKPPTCELSQAGDAGLFYFKGTKLNNSKII